MATVTNFTIEQSDNAKKLIFKESTGAYDALLNTDGWGSPNDVHTGGTATLTITPPNSTTATVYDSTDITGLASFPTTDTGLELEITTDDISAGTDAKHTDGVWTILYTVTTATAVVYTVTHKVFISGSVRCCVYGKLAAIDTVDCDCDSTEKTYALQAFTFYRSLIANAACGNEDKYTELLALTSKLCSTNKC